MSGPLYEEQRESFAWRNRLSRIANSVSPGTPRRSRTEVRHELAAGDAPTLLCVGRLEAVKGPDLLVEAFSRVHEMLPQAQLWLVGEGSQRELLESRVRELGLEGNARLLGQRGDVPDLLAACDLLVLPSRGEGMPTILLEALAASRAVVATRVGAVPEVTSEGQHARLVAPGDIAALAGACVDLLRSRELRARYEHAAAGVADRYRPERGAAELEALYLSCSPGRNPLK